VNVSEKSDAGAVRSQIHARPWQALQEEEDQELREPGVQSIITELASCLAG